MRKVVLGDNGPEVGVIGFGTGAVSGAYGPVDDRPSAIAAVHAALDAGANLIDGGDFYGRGYGEMLVGEALRDRNREDAVISIKYGGQTGPNGRFLGHDFSPVSTKTALGYSLTRLGTDYIDIYRPSRVPHDIPIEETIGAIAEMVDEGYVRYISLSEAGPDDIRRAHAVHPIADVQVEYSLLSRAPENAVIATCRELGIAVTAYGVIGRGLLTGKWNADRKTAPSDLRTHQPRFQGENLEQNLKLVDALREIADARGVTVAQLAIAWVASRGEDVVPLVGGRNPAQLHEAFGAAELTLTDDDLAAIEAAVPAGAAAGERYPEPVLKTLDPSLR